LKGPVFLGLGEVMEIHRDQIERYGGRPGIRDMGLLQSAVSMPAAYLFHIIQNHPFVDGNKRTGAVATVMVDTVLAVKHKEVYSS
jgi:death-on-curing protein